MEDFVWTDQKSKGGGDIIDPFIRACFIQGLHDSLIKTMVKAKGNVNMPIAQLVEVALEEESVIKSERFRKNFSEKEQFGHQGIRNVPRRPNESRQVRVDTVKYYRCKKLGHVSCNCREQVPPSVDLGHVTGNHGSRNRSGRAEGLPGQSVVDVLSQGCVCDVKSADSRLAVVEFNKHNISVELNPRSWRAMRENHMNDDAVVEGVNEDNGPPEITAKLQEINQMGDKRCHQVQQVAIANNREDYSSYPSHPVYNLSSDLRRQRNHSPFVMYVLCNQLKNGMVNVLIDTGSQVSLVTEKGLARGSKIRRHTLTNSWHYRERYGNQRAI